MNDTTTATEWIEYDYAIVRIVPRVHVATFVNVGVILHARTTGFMDARFLLDLDLLRAFEPRLDITLIERYLDAYRRICRGGVEGGVIGMLPPSERFHWLTAPRSAVVQTSAVHPGRSHDLGAALDRLYHEQCCGE